MQRQGIIAIGVIAPLLIGLVLLAGSMSGEPARASHAGGMDALSIDLDTAGNTATSIGTREDCVTASAGTSITFDVTAENIPATTPMLGFSADILYNDAGGRLRVESANVSQLLTSAAGSSLFNSSDPVPDNASNGFWILAGLDLNSSASETGTGVLGRVTLSIAAGAPAGLYTLQLANAAHIDPDSNAWVPDALNDATLAVGVSCPQEAETTDVAIQSVTVNSPATVTVGTPFAVTGSVQAHNNGPTGPANTDVTMAVTLPPDCTSPDPLNVTIQDVSLDTSVTSTVPGGGMTWNVTCAQPSGHLFSLNASIAIDQAGLTDLVAGNDSGQGQAVSSVIGTANLALVAPTVAAPATGFTSTAFDVTAGASVSNAGPQGAASAVVTYTLTVPSQCLRMAPAASQSTGAFAVSASTQVSAPSLSWKVKCDTPGTYQFDVTASVGLQQLHVSDPASGNNSGAAQDSTILTVGICGDDTGSPGTVIDNMGPTLLQLISNLTADGNVVPSGQTTVLDCRFEMNISDDKGAPLDDCQVNLVPPAHPCSIGFDMSIDMFGGTPSNQAGVNLAPIGVTFLPSAFTFVGDTAIPNGTPAGNGYFHIKTDAGLGPQGKECFLELDFEKKTGFEGGLVGNAPDSNLNEALFDPLVWPNDLNAERALVESSLSINPLIPIQLWARMVVPLDIAGVVELPQNVLIWRIQDPVIQNATGGQWVVVSFPGDAIGPDLPGPSGGNPDADDIIPNSPTLTCSPYRFGLSFSGMAGGSLRASCGTPTSPFGWSLLDPDARSWSGDQGPRGDTSTCSLDADGDGLTGPEETYYGTNALDSDTDNDTVLDGPDNCKLLANPTQANFDADDLGDACDPDIDGDGVANAGDQCAMTVLLAQVDANGCSDAQVDTDADGVCNPGAPSAGPSGCTGMDNCPSTANSNQYNYDGDGLGDVCDADEDADGVSIPTELCQFTMLGASVDASGCSDAQVDPDADGICSPGAPSGGPSECDGSDNCPSVANAGQENGDGDGLGDACDLDNDGDGVNDVDEVGCFGDPENPAIVPERLNGIYAGEDDDGDTIVDEGLPAGTENFDCDGDGFNGVVEDHVFGTPGRNQDNCGLDAWPGDLIGGFFSEDKLNIQDLAMYIAEPRRLNTDPGDAGYDVRYDVLPGSAIGKDINLQDMAVMVIAEPAMFGGARAFGGPACTP